MSVDFHIRYMGAATYDLPRVLDLAERHLAEVDFDTIVGTGFSGSIVIPALALKMQKKFLLVRKEEAKTHHRGKVAGELGERWIFVDDFICSGQTRTRVMRVVREAVREWNSWRVEAERQSTEMVGQYLYVDAEKIDRGFEEYTTAWEREALR